MWPVFVRHSVEVLLLFAKRTGTVLVRLMHRVDLFSGVMPVDECTSRSHKGAVGLFGSFTAQLNNGIILSLSTYGPTGQPPNGNYFCVFLLRMINI